MIAYIDGTYRGTSSDKASMPTDNIRNMDVFIEIDTGKIYFYNKDADAWVEFTATE